MGANVQSCTDRILHAIDFGRLSGMETKRRLEQLIEAEVARMDAPADLALVEGCQSLLWQLHMHAPMTSTEHPDGEYQRILATADAQERRVAAVRRALRWCAVAVAALLLVMGVYGRLHWRWFEQYSTPDKQQHVIVGHEVSVEMVDTAIAENENRGSIVVDDVSEIRQLLGFDLDIPQTLGDGWNVQACTLSFFRGYIKVGVMYEHPDHVDSNLICAIHIYNDMEYAYFSFEQSCDGHCKIIANHELYISPNVTRTTVNWYNNLVYVRLAGPVSEDEAVNLMLELIGGNHE